MSFYSYCFIQTCDERGDIKADSVRVSLRGATSDLHGADAK